MKPNQYIINEARAIAGRHIHKIDNWIGAYNTACRETIPEVRELAQPAENMLKLFTRIANYKKEAGLVFKDEDVKKIEKTYLHKHKRKEQLNGINQTLPA